MRIEAAVLLRMISRPVRIIPSGENEDENGKNEKGQENKQKTDVGFNSRTQIAGNQSREKTFRPRRRTRKKKDCKRGLFENQRSNRPTLFSIHECPAKGDLVESRACNYHVPVHTM